MASVIARGFVFCVTLIDDDDGGVDGGSITVPAADIGSAPSSPLPSAASPFVGKL